LYWPLIPSDYSVTGTGTGLYITKMIIEAQNGIITASSDGKEKGACFRIDLPIE
jgi:signal transduction histidine kinase